MNQKNLQQLLDQIRRMLLHKNRLYSGSFAKVPQLLLILFPTGIPARLFPHAVSIIRILDKISRLSSDRTEDTESPWIDASGYSILSALYDHTNSNLRFKTPKKNANLRIDNPQKDCKGPKHRPPRNIPGPSNKNGEAIPPNPEGPK